MHLFISATLLAFRAIARNKTRAALTVLGILIGVAAVVTVTALDGPCIELHTQNAWPHHCWFVLASSGDVFHPISRGPVLRIEAP